MGREGGGAIQVFSLQKWGSENILALLKGGRAFGRGWHRKFF